MKETIMGIMQQNEAKQDGTAYTGRQPSGLNSTQFSSGGNVSAGRGWSSGGASPGGGMVAVAIAIAIVGAVIILIYAAVVQQHTNKINAQTEAKEAKLAAQTSSQSSALRNDVNATVLNVKHGLAANRDLKYIVAHASIYVASSGAVKDTVSIQASVCKGDPKGSYLVEAITPGAQNDRAGNYVVYASAANKYFTGAEANIALIPELVCN